MKTIQLFLLIEGISFLTAALIHHGIIPLGDDHRRAAIAETVICVVLLGGLALTLIRPNFQRTVGIGVQGFAFLGTLIGITMVAIGVGPRTVPDVIYHVAILIVLAMGLRAALRSPRSPAG